MRSSTIVLLAILTLPVAGFAQQKTAQTQGQTPMPPQGQVPAQPQGKAPVQPQVLPHTQPQAHPQEQTPAQRRAHFQAHLNARCEKINQSFATACAKSPNSRSCTNEALQQQMAKVGCSHRPASRR